MRESGEEFFLGPRRPNSRWLFRRSPPKLYVRLRDGLETERVFEGLSGVDFTGARGDVVAVLAGRTGENARAYAEIKSRLKAHRAGRILRLTVAAAEAAAASDFGPFVAIGSLAKRDRFVVWIKARSRSADYVIGRAGRTISKKETASTVLDLYS